MAERTISDRARSASEYVFGLSTRSTSSGDVSASPGFTRWHPKYGGLVIASIGFVLTRFALFDAAHQNTTVVQFLLSGGLALLVGLGIIVGGVSLTVSTLPRWAVRSTAKWCLVGVGGMGFITGIALLEGVVFQQVDPVAYLLTTTYFTNGLIGGAVGGLVIGLYSVANTQQRRALKLEANHATLLNRIIRDKVLNKVNVIQANVGLLRGSSGDSNELDTIARNSADLEQAVADIGFLAKSSPRSRSKFGSVDLDTMIEQSIERATGTHDSLEIECRGEWTASPAVSGNAKLRNVFDRFFDYLAETFHRETVPVRIGLSSDDKTTAVTFRTPDLSLSADERAVLVDGILPKYDDPTVGFDLPILSLLVATYHGEILLEESRDSVEVTFVFPRRDPATSGSMGKIGSGIDHRQLLYATVAATVGGVGMGLILQALTDTLPAIGGLYGVQSVAIGWILHVFHSVVFGILFVAFVDGRSNERPTNGVSMALAGVGYGLVLWVAAAGVVMPIWMNLVGLPTPIPRLTLPSLLGHVTWGTLLGSVYYLLSAAH